MKNLICLISICVLSGCTFFEGDDRLPVYLDVQSVNLITEPFEGAPSHSIKDVWVFVDGASAGVYSTPNVIPILSDQDPTSVILTAGVRNNGTNANPIQYPFYQSISFSETMTEGSTKTVNLDYEYKEDLSFVINESFESTLVFTKDEDDDSTTSMTVSDQEALDGQKSGHMFVTTDNPIIEVSTGLIYQTSAINGSPVFLEIDFKNDIEFFVGFVGVVGSEEIKSFKLIIPPKENWTKIYVDLSLELNQLVLDGYRVLLATEITDPEKTEGNVFIDNVRLIHF